MRKATIITIENEGFGIFILSQNLNEILNLQKSDGELLIKEPFTLKVKYNDDGQINIDDSNGYTISIYEQQKYYIAYQTNTDFSYDSFESSFISEGILNYFPDGFVSLNSRYQNQLLAEFHTKGYVGIWDFSTQSLKNNLIHVSPKKINFDEEYQHMLHEIGNKVSELATRFGSTNKLSFKEVDAFNNKDYLESINIQNIIKEFIDSLDIIIQNPYIQIVEEQSIVPLGRQKKINFKHLVTTPSAYQWIEDGPLSERTNGYTFTTINNISYNQNFDNYPNRFVKYVASYFIEILYGIESELSKISKPNTFDKIRLQDTRFAIDSIEFRISGSFFKEVKNIQIINNNSQVIEKRIGYQDINRLYESLKSHIEIDFETNVEDSKLYYSKPVSDLYEIWCFLQIEIILNDLLGKPINQTLIQTTHTKTKFILKQGKQSCLTYKFKNRQIDLFYNYEFTPKAETYTLIYKPDISIKISNLDTNETIFHHFDAKYKSSITTGAFIEEDLWKMHAYKDGIHNTLTSNILYPGQSNHFFIKNDGTSVSAISLKPGNQKQFIEVKNFVLELLQI